MTRLRLRLDDAERTVSRTLFGLFLEDINFAVEGGLNANLVNNHSFDGVYEQGGAPVDTSVPLEHRPRSRPRYDRARHWRVVRGTLSVSCDDPVAPSVHHARVTGTPEAVLENDGYPGGVPGMAARHGTALLFSALVRADDAADMVVRLVDADGRVVAERDVAVRAGGWRRVTARLEPVRTSLCSLRITVRGVLDLDEIRLVPEDHWGAGDPRWNQGLLRRDVVEALRDLAPRFLRFPGGCVVEGASRGAHYRWKDTVGPLERRRPTYNLWGAHRADGDYSQSFQVGFHEYFQLCEDLGIEPVPVVWAGMGCQFRTDHVVPVDDPAFDEVVQDAIDLVDWATGDPASSPWAALRAAAGHPDPFPLRHLAVGNENHGTDYLVRFERIKGAVERYHPGITVVLSAGPYADGPAFDQAWRYADGRDDLVVDEHFYRAPEWFLRQTTRYDDYDRTGPRVVIGEYAAHLQRSPRTPHPNTWASALAEAAFLTGVVRNADVVTMVSYAPLLNLVGHGQWEHNLLDFDPWRVVPTANAVVQRVFATHVGTRVVPVDADLPDGVHAVATADHGVCHVVLVNTTETPEAVELVTDGPVVARATRDVVTAGRDDANRLPFGEEPRIAVRPERTRVPQDLMFDLPARSVSAVTLALAEAVSPR